MKFFFIELLLDKNFKITTLMKMCFENFRMKLTITKILNKSMFYNNMWQSVK